jgi:hypothetical protein
MNKKLINIEDVYYVLINNITDFTLLTDIIKFKDNSNLNINELPLEAIIEILTVYNIKDKDKIIELLIKD